MTTPDKLTIAQCEEIHAVYPTTHVACTLARQLADTMRENEKLRKALWEAEKLAAFQATTYPNKETINLHRVLFDAREHPNKDSDNG